MCHITKARRFDAQGCNLALLQVLELDEEFEAIDEEEDRYKSESVCKIKNCGTRGEACMASMS